MTRETRLAFVVDGFDPDEAIGKVLLSFSRELRRAYHVQPIIIAAHARAGSAKRLPPGIELVTGNVVKHRVCAVGWLIFLDYYLGVIGRKLARLVRDTPADCYIHFSTCGWSVTKAKNAAPMGFLCNGLVYALLNTEPWYRDLGLHPLIKLPMRLTTPLISSKLYKLGQRFDFYLANSHFMREYLFLQMGYHASQFLRVAD